MGLVKVAVRVLEPGRPGRPMSESRAVQEIVAVTVAPWPTARE